MAFSINDNRPPLEQFLQGEAARAYHFLGSHFENWDGRQGVVFRVWAPNAKSVSVVGDFNDWNPDAHYMYRISDSGVWELFIEGVWEYACYKYCVETPWNERILKTDPYAFHCQTRPDNASRTYHIYDYQWNDGEWVQWKKDNPHKSQAINVYEVNAGSWKKYEDGNFYSYRALADELIPYVKKMGYTHIEFMPLTEFPFDGSWGYQVTGYYAATSRYGEPKDLMYFVDRAHQEGIGIILDWVPAHFPKDAHGLGRFDGTGCYEYEDWRIGEHKEWGTYIFNYGRYEVTSFLISSAMFWLDMYHIDGIRVDAVASMLYLDYNRKDGEWIANAYGGRENLVAVDFLQKLNNVVHMFYPEVMMIAEESTAWPNVTRYPIEGLGLGFDYKWNMGWMNDMLSYISLDPLWRNYHHDTLTFSMVYAFSEDFMLPISHDEVVYGKGSLINKMPGGYDQKFQGVRGFVSYMLAHPGKKLMFMGSEIGQFDEWNANTQLEWNLLEYEKHQQLQHFFATANKFYLDTPAMHENDYDWNGFRWVALDDYQNSVIAFRRIALDSSEILVVCNFQPVTRENYRVAVPVYGIYEEVFNSEAAEFGGTDIKNEGDIQAINEKEHDLDYCISITLPPLGVTYYKLKEELPVPKKLFQEEEEEAEAEAVEATAEEAEAEEAPVAEEAPAAEEAPVAEEAPAAKAEELKEEAPAAKAEEPKAKAPAAKAEEPKEEAPAAKAEEPKAEAPAAKAEEPKAKAPAAKAEKPKAKAAAAKAEKPKAEAPAAKVGEPKAEAPAAKAEEPKAEAPAVKAEEPKAEAPAVKAEEPKEEAPAKKAAPKKKAPAKKAPAKKAPAKKSRSQKDHQKR